MVVTFESEGNVHKNFNCVQYITKICLYMCIKQEKGVYHKEKM